MNRYQQTQAAVDRHYDGIQRAAEQLEHEDRLDACKVWARAQSIAHDDAGVFALATDGTLILADVQVKVGGQFIGADQALYQAVLHQMAGRYDAADCVARDSVSAISEEIERLIRAGRV